MKRFYLVCGAVSLFLTIGLSCHKNDDNGTRNCNFTVSDSQPLSANEAVTYLAGAEGAGGAMTSLSYQDSAGTTTVSNPALPWTKTVNLKTGAKPTLTAVGTANKGGQLNISYVAGGAQSGMSCGN